MTETITSPTLAAQLRQLLQTFPQARWHQFDSLPRDNVREGAALAFGRIIEADYQFDRAAVILSVLLFRFSLFPPGALALYPAIHGRPWRPAAGLRSMNRLYQLESTPSVTGDDGRASPAGQQHGGRALRADVGAEPGCAGGGGWRACGCFPRDGLPRCRAISKQIAAEHPSAGERQPPVVHALAHYLNDKLGNVDQTVSLLRLGRSRANQSISFSGRVSLKASTNSGRVDMLVMLGGNPVYAAPALPI